MSGQHTHPMMILESQKLTNYHKIKGRKKGKKAQGKTVPPPNQIHGSATATQLKVFRVNIKLSVISTN